MLGVLVVEILNTIDINRGRATCGRALNDPLVKFALTDLSELVFFRAFLAFLPYKNTYQFGRLQFLRTYPY